MSGSAKPSDLHVPAHPVRFVTAAALFDGHDAAINIMRRILQAQGAEVIHLGHDRSVRDVVDAVLEEDAQGVAISSYQGGHVEYFRYLVDRLRAAGRGDVPWEDVFRMLNSIGYSGPVSVEWEDAGMDRLTGAPESLAFLRRFDFSPPAASFDAAFSSGNG